MNIKTHNMTYKIVSGKIDSRSSNSREFGSVRDFRLAPLTRQEEAHCFFIQEANK